MAKCTPHVEPACREVNLIGESPVWSVEEQALYWVDTRVGRVHRLDAAHRHRSWSFDGRVGAVGLRGPGELIATRMHTVDTLALADGEPRAVTVARPALADGVRLKEGKVDRRGRYWFGSVGPSPEARAGSLYRLDRGCDVAVEVDRGFMNLNGIAFSADGGTMLMADTHDDRVFAYGLDPSSGDATSRRELFSTARFPGLVDGATCDAEGGFWFAFYGDWAVGRLDPVGRLDCLVRMPVQYPTMCAFGGPALDTMYVTSATAPLTAEALAAQPEAGMLFAIHGLGVHGVAEPLCVV